MILIHSFAEDISTTDVCKWLNHYGAAFVRVNQLNTIKEVSITGHKKMIRYHKLPDSVDMNEIKTYWFRRGIKSYQLKYIPGKGDMIKRLNGFLNNEFNDVYLYINRQLSRKNAIGNLEQCIDINKPDILGIAADMGLKVPEYLITTNKQDLLAFQAETGTIISKALHEPADFNNAKYCYPTYTKIINRQDIDRMPETFFVSFFQRFIAKKCDVRCFCLKGKVYAMAIFPNANEESQVDFRHYDYTVPSRMVPFQLPAEMEQQLIRLCDYLELDGCSADFVYGTDGALYFLEINAAGQFGFTSLNCNYYLERQVARALS